MDYRMVCDDNVDSQMDHISSFYFSNKTLKFQFYPQIWNTEKWEKSKIVLGHEISIGWVALPYRAMSTPRCSI